MADILINEDQWNAVTAEEKEKIIEGLKQACVSAWNFDPCAGVIGVQF